MDWTGDRGMRQTSACRWSTTFPERLWNSFGPGGVYCTIDIPDRESPVHGTRLNPPRAQGSQVAWSALVQEHQEGVFRLAYLLVGDPDEAEDIAQEAFIRAFRMLHRFDPVRPLRPGCCALPATWRATTCGAWGAIWLRCAACPDRASMRKSPAQNRSTGSGGRSGHYGRPSDV